MVADIRPGQAFTPSVPFRDSNGSLVTGATTGSKTMTIYSPSGAVLTSGTVTHQGNGRWGYLVAPSFNVAIGTYTAILDEIVSGSDSLEDQVATYEVGYDNAWTLRELYTRIREDLGDGWAGTTSGSGSTTTLVASSFAYGSNNDWVSSEIFLFEPGAVGDTNPVRVTAFVASTGTFTVTPAITSTVAGQDFIVGNKDGQKWRHAEIMGAITVAVRRVGGGALLVDEETLEFDTQTAEYAAPAAFAVVTGVAYQPSGSDAGAWLPIAGRYWKWHPDSRKVEFTRRAAGLATWGNPWPASSRGYGFDIPQGAKLRLTGRAVPQLPGAMGQAIDANGQQVYDAAMLHLLGGSDEALDRQRAVMLAGLTGRPRVRMPG